MSRLFGFAVLIAVGWYIWQTMRRGALRANHVKPRRKGPDGRLVRDPQTGEYHLERERT